ncbi:hypothetical protein RB195_022809 [Necator americanus]|uniref:Uncharacterized protein n=1 Tax=Necator americanus TaxID=51031 RepID=A0ABR1EGY0_NECAM
MSKSMNRGKLKGYKKTTINGDSSTICVFSHISFRRQRGSSYNDDSMSVKCRASVKTSVVASYFSALPLQRHGLFHRDVLQLDNKHRKGIGKLVERSEDASSGGFGQKLKIEKMCEKTDKLKLTICAVNINPDDSFLKLPEAKSSQVAIRAAFVPCNQASPSP